MVYADKVVYKQVGLVKAEAWLEGELLEDEPQVFVEFRVVNGEFLPLLDFSLADGIDVDSLVLITKFAKQQACKLNEFQNTISNIG